MLKNLTGLQHTVDGKVMHFMCDNDTPLTAVKDALMKFMQYVGQIEDNIKAQQEQQAAEAKAAKEAKAAEAPADVEESKVVEIPQTE